MPGSTIGIIGGSQLAKMMTISAKNMGFRVGILDPSGECPAAQLADWHIIAACDDVLALEALAKRCDVVTYETKDVSVESLTMLVDSVNVPQGTDLQAITQDRLMEKSFMEENNIVIAPYETIISPTDIQDAIDSIGFPCVLRTTRDSDQHYILNSMSDLAPSMGLLRQGTCILEAMIPFEKEVSVQVAGNGEQYTVFPIAQTIYRDQLLFETIVPADVPTEVNDEMRRITVQIAQAFNLHGILTIEMFLSASGSIYVRRLIPRVHNSGNYSLDVCNISQFDAHLRGICGWPLGTTQLFSKAVTVNILREKSTNSRALIGQKPAWNFYFYGKKELTDKTKIGHITIPTMTPGTVLAEIEDADL
ncbi:MAG TPA: 5-(carboxyamino)imidazole ribonucleotide synthase [Tetragenococcus sp.]|nr:5-(carboxyamino)imidazole ribonucleotide synthase [Tetragenococcus sp.]